MQYRCYCSGYEWDIGHFRGVRRPSVDCFRNTSFGLSQEEVGSLSDVSVPNVNSIRVDIVS